MRTRLLLRRPDGRETAVVVTTDVATTTGAVAAALLRADPGPFPEGGCGDPGEAVLRVRPPGATEFRVAPREASVAEGGVRRLPVPAHDARRAARRSAWAAGSGTGAAASSRRV